MKLTLLEYVQDILNDMNSDDVESIFDTVESEQVAQIVKSSYYSLISNRNWPHTKKRIQLDSPADSSLPVYLSLPDNVKELVSIHYDKVRAGETRKRYQEMRWVENDAFLRQMSQLNNDNSNVDLITDASGIELMVRNDVGPTLFTSFNDKDLIFDSYDSAVETFLDSDKVQAIAYTIPDWTMDDTFTPDLPSEAVTALLEEAKSRAMFRLKQMTDSKAEQASRRQQSWLSRKAWRANGGIRYPNYGRKGRKRGHSPYLDKNNPTP